MKKLVVAVILAVVLALAALVLGTHPTLAAREGGEFAITTRLLPSVADIIRTLDRPDVREVEIRGLALTRAEVADAFLSTNPSRNILLQLGRQLLPREQVDFRTADGQRFRVRHEDGELRVRVSDALVRDHVALAEFFARNGVERVEIRGTDGAGNRVRLELRDGVLKRDEAKPDPRGRGGARSDRGELGTSLAVRDARRVSAP